MRQKKVTRREALAAIGVAGAAISLGCGDEMPTSPSAMTATGATDAGGTTAASCAVTPSETVGPYPVAHGHDPQRHP